MILIVMSLIFGTNAFAMGGHGGSGCPKGMTYQCHGGSPHQPQYCECEGSDAEFSEAVEQSNSQSEPFCGELTHESGSDGLATLYGLHTDTVGQVWVKPNNADVEVFLRKSQGQSICLQGDFTFQYTGSGCSGRSCKPLPPTGKVYYFYADSAESRENAL